MSLEQGHGKSPIQTRRRLATVIIAIAFGLGVLAPKSSSADSWDVPRSIAVDLSGDVWITLVTDTGTGYVRKFSEAGQVETEIMVDSDVGSVEEAPGGGVVVVFREAEQVVRFVDDQETGRFDVLMLVDALGVGSIGRSLNPSPYVLRQGRDSRVAARFRSDGSEMAGWEVDASAYGLAAGPWSTAPEGAVYIATRDVPIAGQGRIERWLPDGTGRTVSDVLAGEPGGMDVAPDGWLYTALTPELAIESLLVRLDESLEPETLCTVPGRSIDMSLAPDGSVYLIVDKPLTGELAVLRIGSDCALISEWDQRVLSGISPTATPSPSPGQGTVSPTRTHTPTATTTAGLTPTGTETAGFTPTGTALTATSTRTQQTPTSEHTSTPTVSDETPVATSTGPGTGSPPAHRLFVPFASRS